jgi:hypothetical protein
VLPRQLCQGCDWYAGDVMKQHEVCTQDPSKLTPLVPPAVAAPAAVARSDPGSRTLLHKHPGILLGIRGVAGRSMACTLFDRPCNHCTLLMHAGTTGRWLCGTSTHCTMPGVIGLSPGTAWWSSDV